MIGKIKSEVPPPFERDRVGRYDIIYPLACGGMANVYVGRLYGMAGFEKLVTLKLIHSHLSTQREFVDMFLDEARIAARVHHPNIGEIYEIVEDRGQLFIAAEFVDGHSLSHLLRESRTRNIPLSCTLAAWICAEVCQGLQFVHDLKDEDGTPLHLVHRDISPSNILVSYSGWVKLIDFGVAFARNRLAHTSPGNLKGKIGYISPEQIKGDPLDRRADIFSLGVILYLFVTGKHPFPGKSEAERLKKTLYCEMVPPSTVSKTVDIALETIILKALAVSPEKRYQQASELEADLRRYISATKGKFGASELAPVMQLIFEDEIDVHQKQLLAFRQRQQQQAEAAAFADDNVVYLTRAIDPVTRLSTTMLCRPTSEQLQPDGIKWKKRAAVGSVALIALGAFLWMVYAFFINEAPDTRPGAHPASIAMHNEHATASDMVQENCVQTDSLPKAPIEDTALNSALKDILAVVKIPVVYQPEDVELLLKGEQLDLISDAFQLPNDGKEYEVVARAPGYVTKTYTVTARLGESLNVALSPVPSERSGNLSHSRGVSNATGPVIRYTKLKNGARRTKKVLIRNPY